MGEIQLSHLNSIDNNYGRKKARRGQPFFSYGALFFFINILMTFCLNNQKVWAA